MPRTPIIIANWKMVLSYKATLEIVRSLKKLIKTSVEDVTVVVCPSFPSLADVAKAVSKTSLMVGAQAVYWEEAGSVTGAVSVQQLTPFVSYCIIGHSEYRRLTGQTDEQVAQQASLLLRHGITPIICVGEDAAQYEAGQTVAHVTGQVKILLQSLGRMSAGKIVLAYEPIWAISANNPSTPPEPGEMASIMLLLRKLVADQFDSDTAERVRIVYGGSVNTDTINDFMHEPGVDGVLVGSASLKPAQFAALVQAVAGTSKS